MTNMFQKYILCRMRVCLSLSSLRDLKGMDWPEMALTSSSFLAFIVTKVTGRDSAIPGVLAATIGSLIKRERASPLRRTS